MTAEQIQAMADEILRLVHVIEMERVIESCVVCVAVKKENAE
jgi:hypothetical protein